MVVRKDKKPAKIVTKTLSLGKALLLGLAEATELTLRAFYAHPYYHTFCTHGHKHDSGRIAVKRLERRGLIIRKDSAPDTFLLTKKGRELARHLQPLVRKDEPWDGKWRVLVFDIPEQRRHERRFLRAELRNYGFHRLQKSVWITPHKVEGDFIGRLNAVGRFGKDVEFMVVESTSNAKKLEKLFSLRQPGTGRTTRT